MSDVRDFKGVWIPKEIWLNEELTLLEKVILVEIDSLDNAEHCTASNEYLAKFCNCSVRKVSEAITKLASLGLVEVTDFDGRHRKIKSMMLVCMEKFARQGSKICQAESQNLLPSNIDNKQNNKINSNSNKLELENYNFLTKSKQQKQSLYSKCIALINNKTEDELERRLLENWLQLLLEKYKDRDKTLYVNVFKGKLNTLDKYDKKDWLEIIEYNLQKGYEAFYPIKNYGITEQVKPWEDGVTSISYTEQEKQEMEDWQNEMRKQGIRVDF